jgi:hypothetical protein
MRVLNKRAAAVELAAFATFEFKHAETSELLHSGKQVRGFYQNIVEDCVSDRFLRRADRGVLGALGALLDNLRRSRQTHSSP